MTTEDAVAQVQGALASLITEAGGPDRVITPRGWRHMGLVIIDAVFSLQARYDATVRPMLARYCDAAPGLSWDEVNESSLPEHDAQHLLEFLGPMPLEQRYAILNRQLAPGTARGRSGGRPKAEVVTEVAETLVRRDAFTRQDFAALASDDTTLEWDVRKVTGVGLACWKYMLNLSGAEVSKPDTMVLRWLTGITGNVAISALDAATLIESATRNLDEQGVHVTVRQVDHLVWRKASGRPLTDTSAP